jgi:hypothetical protein
VRPPGAPVRDPLPDARARVRRRQHRARPRGGAADRSPAARDKQLVVERGSHVGAVVSRKAASRLWPALHTFWAQRDWLRSHGERNLTRERCHPMPRAS